MEYIRVYKQLIRKCRGRVVGNLYYEKHHIIPKCLGGKGGVDNIVKLLAREHYIAHLLLVKILKKRNKKDSYYKLLWAFNYMTCGNNNVKRKFKYNSKLYEQIKKQLKHSVSTKEKIANSHLGKRLSESTKQKISKTRKRLIKQGIIERPSGCKNGMYGKKLSTESKAKISKAHIGRKDSDITKCRKSLAFMGQGNPRYGKKMSDEHKKIISKANLGRKQTIEHIVKRTERNKGKIHVNNGKVNRFVTKEEFIDKWVNLKYVKGMKSRKGEVL